MVDWEEVENAESIRDVSIKRFKDGEVFFVSYGGKFRFPCKDGALKQAGISAPRRRRIAPEPLAQGDLGHDNGEVVEPDEPLELAQDDTIDDALARGDAGPQQQDCWAASGGAVICFHVIPRKKLFIPVEGELPIPLKYIDVQRRTETNI